MLRCVQDLNLNQTGVFWFVKNGMVHIQGRFASSQVSPGGAAFGSVLLVEPLNGGWSGMESVCLATKSRQPCLCLVIGRPSARVTIGAMWLLIFRFQDILQLCSPVDVINRFERHVD